MNHSRKRALIHCVRCWLALLLLLLGAQLASAQRLPINGINTFVKGTNLAWLDGQYDHDIGINPLHPQWGCYYTGTVAHALTFGSGSGEGIGSTRVAGNTDIDGLNFYTAFTKRLTILNNGNIGIGTANPGFLLEADSGGVPKFELDSSGNLHCSGTVYSQGVALTSDRNAKENFQPVDNQTVLAKVAALPVTQWNYKTDSKGVQHIGPMAQDFQAAFGLDGADDKHISVVDEGGVALAAIQGLNQKLEQKETEITELKARLEKLEQLINQKNGGKQ